MTISGSEFEGEAIDMDSVAFAGNYACTKIKCIMKQTDLNWMNYIGLD